MLPTLIAVVVILALAAVVVGMVVVGLEGTGRHKMPGLAQGLARAGRHLNGEGTPPQALLSLWEEAELGAADLKALPGELARKAASARSAISSRSALSARSARSALSPTPAPATPEPATVPVGAATTRLVMRPNIEQPTLRLSAPVTAPLTPEQRVAAAAAASTAAMVEAQRSAWDAWSVPEDAS